MRTQSPMSDSILLGLGSAVMEGFRLAQRFEIDGARTWKAETG